MLKKELGPQSSNDECILEGTLQLIWYSALQKGSEQRWGARGGVRTWAHRKQAIHMVTHKQMLLLALNDSVQAPSAQ